MRGRIMLLVPTAIITLVFLGAAGCGGSAGKPGGGGAKMTLPELGLSMRVPSGWTLDKHNSGYCFKGNDNNGTVIAEPLAGKTLDQYVNAACKEFGGKVMSKKPLELCGCKAVEAIVDHPAEGKREFLGFIKKGDKVIQVGFTVSQSEFPKCEAALREALNSLEIK